MHAAILCAAVYLSGFFAAPPVVEQTVEMVSVAHVAGGVELVFFWSIVQDEWTCLDHRWLSSGMIVAFSGDSWTLAWLDESSECCYRIVHTRHWVETWESSSPMSELNQRPWFRQLLHCGLAQPRRAEQ